MKHVLKPSLYLVALVAISCLFYACSDEELSDVSNPAQEADFTVRVKNGYLEFKDQAAFDQVKASLENIDDEALNAWESQFEGFTSLRSVAVRAIEEQESWYDELASFNSEDISRLRHNGDLFYSNFIKEKPSIFVLEDSGRYVLNVSAKDQDMESFINENGLIKIGNDLYQYRKQSIKTIHGGDESKLYLLPDLTESSREHNITVSSIHEELIDLNNGSGINARVVNGGTCFNDRGDDRVKGFAAIDTRTKLDILGNTPNTGQLMAAYSFTVKAESWREKGLFGGWIQKRTRSLRVEGNLNISSISPDIATVSVGVNVVQSNYRWYYQRTVWGTPFVRATSLDAVTLNRPTVIGDLTYRGRNGTVCSI